MVCARCSKSHNNVQAFLLTCNSCDRKWHHRCHIPPVSDQELILRIKAHNNGDAENGLKAWKCKRCTKNGNTSVGGTPGPQTPVDSPTPQAQPLPRPSASRNVLSSESNRPPPLQQKSSHFPNSLDVAPGAERANASRNQSHGRGKATFSAQTLQRSLSATQSRRPVPSSNNKDDDVIVIDDSDSDSSRPAPSRSTRSNELKFSRSLGAAPTEKLVNDRAPTASIPPTAQPFPLKLEEKSDLSRKPPASTKLPSQSTYDQSPAPITPYQYPIRAVTAPADEDIKRPAPPLDRQRLAKKTTTPRQPLSQSEKTIMRDEFKKSAAEKEKRKRLEHRLRQQQIFQAKIEERESVVEKITSEVVDLDLNNDQHPHVAREEPPLSSELVDGKGSLPTETTAAVADIPTNTLNESNLAPRWFSARAVDDNIWAQELKGKGSTDLPSATRRKATAQKLGEVRPQLYQFDAERWVDAMKRGRY